MTNSTINLKDPKSFEAIYKLYWKKVFATCYNHIQEVEPAREMVQDIFKSLWERREELEITGSIDHYLARAAKFKVFEYIRNKTSQQKHQAIVSQQVAYAANCTEEDVLFSTLRDKLEVLVEKLPTQCKRVFRMSRVDGMSNREIATALVVSERAVEQHITKALGFLKTNLLEYAGTGV